jgi:hypothetical protein
MTQVTALLSIRDACPQPAEAGMADGMTLEFGRPSSSTIPVKSCWSSGPLNSAPGQEQRDKIAELAATLGVKATQ